MENHVSQSLNVFYCYAHEDHALRDELNMHLAGLRHSDLIKAWYDGELLPGASWEKEIEMHLRTAHIILLLVSASFLHSDYCYGKEMAHAVKRHEEKKARVIPILLRSTDYSNAPFNHLQRLPSDDVPVTSWSNRDEAFTNVVRGIRRVVDDLLSQYSATLNIPLSVLPSNQPSQVAATRLLSDKKLPETSLSSEKSSLNDDFLKWLKKTAARPIACKGQVVRGICQLHSINAVSSFEAKQFPGTNIIAGESIQCLVTFPGERYPWYHCLANESVAEEISEAAEGDLLEVALECLGFLKQYTTLSSIGDDEDSVYAYVSVMK